MKVILTDYAERNSKILAVKQLRTLTGWGLIESKNAIDAIFDGYEFEIPIQDGDFPLLAEFGFSYIIQHQNHEELIDQFDVCRRGLISLINLIDFYETRFF